MTKTAILVKLIQAKTGSVRFKGEGNRSTPLNSTGRSNILSQLKQPILLFRISIHNLC
jgi:hypothetical protein